MILISKVPKYGVQSSHIALQSAIANVQINSFFSFLTLICFVFMLLHSSPGHTIDLPDFKGLVADKGRAVVKVTVTASSNDSRGPGSLPNFNEDEMPEFFRRFFEQMPDMPGVPPGSPPPGGSPEGFGSGFVLSEDGYIVTNAHVVKNAVSIVVDLPDRRQFDASLIGADERTDVAVLKVNASGLPALSLGDSAGLKVGQWVLAIGSPFGFEYTATQGIVSALARSLPNDTYVPFIQTDVAVNPGNSGGPLFDLDGNVIGVNSQIFSRSGGYMGLSFAIPADIVKSVVRQLREKGYVSRGWLGVTIQDVDQALADSFGLEVPAGALIAQITPDSPAASAGLQVGDVILSFNDQPLSLSSDLPPMVGNAEVGQSATMQVLRDRQKISLDVVIRELEEDRTASAVDSKPSKNRALGLVVAPLDEARKQKMNLDNGVLVIGVEEKSVAATAGIINDDVIVAFGPDSVTSPAQLTTLVENSPTGQAVAVLIHRNNNPLFVALTFP